MFNRISSNFKVFCLKPLKFERAVSIIDWATIWSVLFVLIGVTSDPNAVYFYMELRNSLIAGGI